MPAHGVYVKQPDVFLGPRKGAADSAYAPPAVREATNVLKLLSNFEEKYRAADDRTQRAKNLFAAWRLPNQASPKLVLPATSTSSSTRQS